MVPTSSLLASKISSKAVLARLPSGRDRVLSKSGSTPSSSPIEKLSEDLVVLVLWFLPQENWMNILVCSKKMYKAGKKAFDPSIRGNWAICWAAKAGKLDVVRNLLKDPRVDPAVGDNYPLKWAIKNRHSSVVMELMQNRELMNLQDPELLLLLLHAVKFHTH